MNYQQHLISDWYIFYLIRQAYFEKENPYLILNKQEESNKFVKQPCEVIVKTWGFYDVLQKDMEIGFKNNLHTAFMGW